MPQSVQQIRFSQPQIHIVNRETIRPKSREQGRKSFVTLLPFWVDLVQTLNNGIGRGEAVEIEIPTVKGPDNKPIEPAQMINRIRYQFHKIGMDKRYRLLNSTEPGQIYIVDNETDALREARKRA